MAKTRHLKVGSQQKKVRQSGPGPGAATGWRVGGAIAALFTAGIALAGALLVVGLSLNTLLEAARAEDFLRLGLVAQKAAPLGEEEMATVEIVERVAPSVVSVEVFKDGGSGKATTNGSGVVISADGYIVTNAHVVEAEGAVRVTLHDGKHYAAFLVGADTALDLAVLRIHKTGLQPAEFGDSDEIQVGERVVAIGNAAGILPGTPTQGIISGVDRDIAVQSMDGTVSHQLLLQTDAAINPGNSGGALVNGHGQVIGINVSKLQSVDIDNIGFAIPANSAVPAINAILESAWPDAG